MNNATSKRPDRENRLVCLKKWRLLLQAQLQNSLKGRALAYYASSSLGCQFLRFVGIVVSTRLLQPEDFGFFAQTMLLLGVLCLLRDPGLNNALVAYSGTDTRYARFHFQAVSTTSNACILLIAAVTSIWPQIAPDAAQNAGLLETLVLLEGLAFTGTVMAQKKFKFRALAGIEMTAVASWLAVIVCAHRFFVGVELLLYARLVETAVRTLLVGVLETWKHVGFGGGSHVLSYFTKYAKHGVLQTATEGMIGQIDTFLLNNFGNIYQLGIFERIQQFIRIPLSLSINLLDKVAVVSFSQHQNERARLLRLLRTFLGLSIVSSTIVIVVVSFAFPWLLGWTVGHDWMTRLWPLWMAAIPIMVLRPVVWCINLFLVGVGNLRALSYLLTCLLIVLGGVGMVLVPSFGAAGMLITQAIGYLVLLGYQAVVVRRWFLLRSEKDESPLQQEIAPTSKSSLKSPPVLR